MKGGGFMYNFSQVQGTRVQMETSWIHRHSKYTKTGHRVLSEEVKWYP